MLLKHINAKEVIQLTVLQFSTINRIITVPCLWVACTAVFAHTKVHTLVSMATMRAY